MRIKPVPVSLAIIALLLASILALITPAVVSAATVTATIYTDRATGACATTGSGDCSLRETTIYANAHPGTTILIEPGTYVLSIPPNGSDDATTGDLNLTNDTTMTTPNGTLAILDGGGQDRILSTGNGMTATTVTLRNLTFRNGNAGSGNGGAIFGGYLNLVNCTVTGNRAASGGGIDGFPSLLFSVISNNVAQGFGGGVYGDVGLTDSTISGNSAQYGGAISGGAGLIRSTISGNTATAGAPGIYSIGRNISVLNSTISGNIGPGAAVFASATIGYSTIIDSTIVGNTSGLSESTDLNAYMAVENTILANNGPNCADRVYSGDYNLSSDTSCAFTRAHDRQGINPQIGPLTDNTGPTKTHALLPGSPAIDAGSCFGIDGMTPITTDQRGIARPQGAGCDVGAVEYAPIHASPPPRGAPPQNSHPIPMPVTRTPPSSGSSGARPNPLPPHR